VEWYDDFSSDESERKESWSILRQACYSSICLGETEDTHKSQQESKRAAGLRILARARDLSNMKQECSSLGRKVRPFIVF
jgi:hypothetical protein